MEPRTEFEIQCLLIKGVDELTLNRYLTKLKLFHLDEVIEERRTEDNCVYPACFRRIAKKPKSLRELTRASGEEDSKLLESWCCSKECFSKITQFRDTLRASTSFARSQNRYAAARNCSQSRTVEEFLGSLDGSSFVSTSSKACEETSVPDAGKKLNCKSVKVSKYKAAALARRSANAQVQEPSKISPICDAVIEKSDTKVSVEMGSSDTAAFLVAADRLRGISNNISTKSSVSITDASLKSLPVANCVACQPNPSEADKAIWQEIFGRPYDADADATSEEDLKGSDVAEQRVYVTIWAALDDIFENDACKFLSLNEDWNEHKESMVTAAPASTLFTLLRRGLQSAESQLNLLDLCPASQSTYHRVKGRLLTRLRPTAKCPPLTNTIWTGIGVVIVDAVLRANKLVETELWEAGILQTFNELSVAKAESDILRSYFD